MGFKRNPLLALDTTHMGGKLLPISLHTPLCFVHACSQKHYLTSLPADKPEPFFFLFSIASLTTFSELLLILASFLQFQKCVASEHGASAEPLSTLYRHEVLLLMYSCLFFFLIRKPLGKPWRLALSHGIFDSPSTHKLRKLLIPF